MKQLIILLITLFIFSDSFSQVYQATSYYGEQNKRSLNDSTFHPPFRSKSIVLTDVVDRPAVIVATEDTALYIAKKMGQAYLVKILDQRDTAIIDSMIKTYVLAQIAAAGGGGGGGANFANTNLSLAANRVHNFNSNKMTWDKVEQFAIYNSAGSGMKFLVDEPSKSVKLGDIDNVGNGTKVVVDDNNKTLDFVSPSSMLFRDMSNNEFLNADFSHRSFIFGDASNTGNRTQIFIDDVAKIVNLQGYNVTLGDGTGLYGNTNINIDALLNVITITGGINLDEITMPNIHNENILNIDAGGNVGFEHQPWIYASFNANTNNSSDVQTVLSTFNRQKIRVKVSFSGGSATGKMVVGEVYGNYYNSGGTLISVSTGNIEPLASVSMTSPTAVLQTTGGNIEFKVSTNVADGAISWVYNVQYYIQ